MHHRHRGFTPRRMMFAVAMITVFFAMWSWCLTMPVAGRDINWFVRVLALSACTIFLGAFGLTVLFNPRAD
jgi:hypothetical protein